MPHTHKHEHGIRTGRTTCSRVRVFARQARGQVCKPFVHDVAIHVVHASCVTYVLMCTHLQLQKYFYVYIYIHMYQRTVPRVCTCIRNYIYICIYIYINKPAYTCTRALCTFTCVIYHISIAWKSCHPI